MTTAVTLKADILNIVDDNSPENTAYLPTAIRLAEDAIFDAVPELECFKGVTTFNISTAESNPPLTNEIIRSLVFTDTDNAENKTTKHALENRPEEVLDLYDDADGPARFFCITGRSTNGTNIRVAPWNPETNHAYSLIIRTYSNEYIDASVDASMTWISVNAYNCLLFGSCVQMSEYMMLNPEIKAGYEQKFQSALQTLAAQADIQLNIETDTGRRG